MKANVAPQERLRHGWPEFDASMCDRLNEEQCLVIAAPSAAFAARVASVVDELLDSPAGDSHRSDAPQPPSSLAPLRQLLRTQFTTPEHISMLQGCTAVHGRCPMLALVDMCDDDDGYAYVLDLPLCDVHEAKKTSPGAREVGGDGSRTASSSVSENGSAAATQQGPSSSPEFLCTACVSPSLPDATSDDDAELVTTVAAFLRRVRSGVEPRAPQGAPPPPGDLVEPRHGAVLVEGRTAVASTWHRLLRSKVDDEGGGALVVFWSDRCAVCPGVLSLLDALVGALRKLASSMYARCCEAAGVPATVLKLFPFLVCNIDENDYPPEDWPSRCCSSSSGKPPHGARSMGEEGSSTEKGEEQRVPTIAGYSHSGRLVRTVFQQSRTATNLVRFMLDTCVGPAGVSFCFHYKFTQAAIAMAAALDTDALMDTFAEDAAPFQRALAAYRSLGDTGSSSPTATVAAVEAELRSIQHAHLDSGCVEKHHCPTIAQAVDAVLANLESCPASTPCGDDAGGCRVPRRASAKAGPSEGARRDGCCFLANRPLRSTNASPVPFGPPAAAGSGEVPVAGKDTSRQERKRIREEEEEREDPRTAANEPPSTRAPPLR